MNISELSGSVKLWKSLDLMSNNQLLKSESATWMAVSPPIFEIICLESFGIVAALIPSETESKTRNT
jgi:hypothetical protein